MISSTKHVLVINLETKTCETKSFPELHKFIGGVGIGIKLLETYGDFNPIILSVGPLNGYFPFASKTSIVLKRNKNIEDLYIGGSLSVRIKCAGYDAIVLLGQSKRPLNISLDENKVDFYDGEHDIMSSVLPGRSSLLKLENSKVLLDSYFETSENFLYTRLYNQGIRSIVFTGTKTFAIQHVEKYKILYHKLLQRTSEMTVEAGAFPSCSGCPMGCINSQKGEIGGNILVHSLVGCTFAEKVFSDVGTVFSCLNVLGYDYTHEDIENLPDYVEKVLKDLNG